MSFLFILYILAIDLLVLSHFKELALKFLIIFHNLLFYFCCLFFFFLCFCWLSFFNVTFFQCFSPKVDAWLINVQSLIAQLVKNPPAMQETPVRFLGWEDPLEKGKATHSSILAWSKRVGHD